MTLFRRLFCLLLAAMLLAGCGKPDKPPTTQATEAVVETVPETTAAPEYLPVMTADGKPLSLGCRDRYTEESLPTEDIVATFGDDTLTGKQLQVYYALTVASCKAGSEIPAPDFSVPLFAQRCEATQTPMSWEQYFLSRAMHTWQVTAALIQASHGLQPAEDPGFLPTQEQHELYLPEGLPVLADVYGDKEGYEMPAMHQQWLQELPDTLAALAQRFDCGSAAELAVRMGTDEASLLQVCDQLTRAYSYYVNLWELSQLKAEEAEGTPVSVDIRQLLLVPEEAQIAADGTVTASEASWQAAERRAQEEYDRWLNSYATIHHSEATFAAMANQISADASTAVDGGSLNGITKGQLIPVLDAWCFDPQRMVGDSAVLRSDYGVSIVYLSGIHSSASLQAEVSSLELRMQERLAPIVTMNSLMPDYSAVRLYDASSCPTLSDVLYPDVGHEQIDRFPAFFQQDYPYIPYGKYTMPIGGCGVTSLAMLATYMSDTLMTPTELAGIYGNEYATVAGTNGDMYTQVTPELGFYVDKTCFDWPTVAEAMAQGQSAISLQMNGPFTKGGHYLLLSTMKEDGTVVVRDPSITHYVKLSGFKTGSFDGGVVNSASGMYWIFQNKILTIPACSRCGNSRCYALQGDYICRRCTRALARRNDFTLTVLGQ